MVQTRNPAPLKLTPLHEWHVARGARMVPFAGWEMPLYYTGISRESTAVRHKAGVFDVSHMGRLRLTGHGAEPCLQRLTVNDISALAPGAGQYTLMLREDGGILDDMIVYRSASDAFEIVVNASNREKVIRWVRGALPAGARLMDETRSTALLALQGPEAPAIARALGVIDLPGRFHFTRTSVLGTECSISRTGYTAEDGIEIMLPAESVYGLWQKIVDLGAEPCGLGSRDTLRLEAAYCLYGHEIGEDVNPLEAGLSRVVKERKGDFVGRDALSAATPRWSLAGVRMRERSVPRQGQAICIEGRDAGRVTSGTFSPMLGESIALALLKPRYNVPGLAVAVDAGNRLRRGEVVELPFYRSKALAP